MHIVGEDNYVNSVRIFISFAHSIITYGHDIHTIIKTQNSDARIVVSFPSILPVTVNLLAHNKVRIVIVVLFTENIVHIHSTFHPLGERRNGT